MSKLRDVLAGANRLQQSTPFKIVASIVVLVAVIASISAYVIASTAPASAAPGAASPAAQAPATEPAQPGEREMRSAYEQSQRIVQDILSRRTSPTNVAAGIAIAGGLALVVVWLGLGLTYLALAVIAVGVALPLRWLGAPGLSQILLGMAALTAAFTALMQGLRLLLSGPGPVMAVARNVLTEAVRMRVSLVFIVVLIFGLAALPLLLDANTPLRYRVQSFLQWGTAGSYWLIAILTLAFAVASVAFEQRDRQIWQTMTKPVSAWQYVFGKWLGVTALSAVLLAVCCAGIFLFTEYLRQQPALGEDRAALLSGTGLSEDRRVLETQVLAARRAVGPDLPLSPGDPQFQAWLKRYIEDAQKIDPEFGRSPAMFDKVASDLFKSYEQRYRTVPQREYRSYVFSGLVGARDQPSPITLRYRIDAGSNMPDQLYRISFLANGVLIQPPAEVTLGHTHVLDLPPTLIDSDGKLELVVHNGALAPNPDGSGSLVLYPNPEALSFPSGGLEVYYPAGSYQMNFLRVALVLWVKLSFLAMLAVAAATFLSFPVACLVAFSVFLMAEGTGFLAQSLEYYDAADQAGNIIFWKIPIRVIGLGVTWMFKTYSDLRPTTRLVDGRMMEWMGVAWGAMVLAAWTLTLFGAGVGVFRKRELATYSGN